MSHDLVLASQQNLFQSSGPILNFARRQRAFGFHRFVMQFVTPAAQHVVIFQAEAERIHFVVTGGALCLDPMLFQLFAQRKTTVFFSSSFVQCRHVGRWWRNLVPEQCLQ